MQGGRKKSRDATATQPSGTKTSTFETSNPLEAGGGAGRERKGSAALLKKGLGSMRKGFGRFMKSDKEGK